MKTRQKPIKTRSKSLAVSPESSYDCSESSLYDEESEPEELSNATFKMKEVTKKLIRENKKQIRRKQKESSLKSQLVKKLLCRWWYVLEFPKKESYDTKLDQLALREVTLENWRLEPNMYLGKTKVVQLRGYAGIFRDSEGRIFDLRDMTDKPSYVNLMKRGKDELRDLLNKAMEIQLETFRSIVSKSKAEQEIEKKLSKSLQEQKRKKALLNLQIVE